MTRTSVIKLFLLGVWWLSSGVHAHQNMCMPKSPEEYACTDTLISEESKELMKKMTIGGVFQQVEGSDAEKEETLRTIMSMTVYLQDLKNQHPDVYSKW